MARRLPIGEIFLEQGRLDAVQLRSALGYQQQWGGRLGSVLVTLGFVTEAEVMKTVARQLQVPFVEIGDRSVPRAVLRLVPEKLIRARKVFPLMVLPDSRRGRLLVAFRDPGNLSHVDEVAFASGMEVKPVLASERDIERAIARHLDGAGRVRRLVPIDLCEERPPLAERRHTPRRYH